MKKYLFLTVFFAASIVLVSCKNQSVKSKIIGNWKSVDGKTGLKITQKEFILDEGEEPIAENYFIKGDTIFTSYEGSQPYTKFGFKELSEKSMTIIYPDSTSKKFVR